MTGFVPNMIGLVLKITEFVLNTTEFFFYCIGAILIGLVQNMTVFVLNKTPFFLNIFIFIIN